jgi:hypothetical protein
VVEYTVTRLRRLVRERSSGETMSIEELSEVPWLEMWDLIDAGLANRGDLSQALFMRDLRPLHPEWSPTELRRWTDGGRWRHAIKFGRPFPYCERCGRHFDHGTRMSGHLCSTCDQGGENLPCR